MSNRPLRLTLSKIDLLISCQNLLPHGDPILVDPSSILPGGQATNLESPLTPLLPLILSVSKSHSLCLQILPRTQPLLINSTAITTIPNLDYCRTLFSPSSVVFTRAGGILLTSMSQPVTLLTTLSWLLSHLASKSLQDPKKAHSVWPQLPLCFHLLLLSPCSLLSCLFLQPARRPPASGPFTLAISSAWIAAPQVVTNLTSSLLLDLCSNVTSSVTTLP